MLDDCLVNMKFSVKKIRRENDAKWKWNEMRSVWCESKYIYDDLSDAYFYGKWYLNRSRDIQQAKVIKRKH